MEEVRSNGNYYKQRIEQLQQEPADADRDGPPAARAGAGAVGGNAELGRLNAQAQEAGPLREEQSGCGCGSASSRRCSSVALGSYDQARHEAVVREIRALEPLALQAERLRVVAERSDS